ncbi:hypothetical protein LVD15_06545 [Fulvivirga maritima]|uniref:HEPN domain-containing protein n=1 Tax=Fulvivirga maritima TaxID=2904247 RepID=UPI001F325CBB|nr:HEPN domain-containing protein [Fulvivirga maritima]UII28080.1 hypothetical protein LVD15_06545 [Fulvivirga maritima]
MEQSNSYISFKNRTQEIFDFAVLITSSVPTFKHNLKLFESGEINRLSEPDYFQPSVIYEITQSTLVDLEGKGLIEEKLEKLSDLVNIPLNNREFKESIIARIGKDNYQKYRNTLKRQSADYIKNLRECSKAYQKKLASYLYFSLFSYFEAFIGDLVNEVINDFNKLNIPKHLEKVSNIDFEKEIRILDRKYDPRKIDRYKKYSEQLINKGYVKPEHLMFSSMLDILKDSNENMKANDIPDFLKKFFFFELSPSDNEIYHNLKSNRNSLGHGGTTFTPTLKSVIDSNKFFKRISKKIDTHVTRNFMNLNNFKTP